MPTNLQLLTPFRALSPFLHYLWYINHHCESCLTHFSKNGVLNRRPCRSYSSSKVTSHTSLLVHRTSVTRADLWKPRRTLSAKASYETKARPAGLISSYAVLKSFATIAFHRSVAFSRTTLSAPGMSVAHAPIAKADSTAIARIARSKTLFSRLRISTNALEDY